MEGLTYKDCDKLIEGVEKWENDVNLGGALFETLMDPMVPDGPARFKFEIEKKKRKEQEEIEHRERKRYATQLKSKLYAIQEQITFKDAGVTSEKVKDEKNEKADN